MPPWARYAPLVVLAAACSGTDGQQPALSTDESSGASPGSTAPTDSVNTTPPATGETPGTSDSTTSATSTGGTDATSGSGGDASPAYNEAVFGATHNSYTGDKGGGEVGPIHEQLDAGIRCLEFDVHTDDYAANGYRMGHDGPGDEVLTTGGNPTSLALSAWLTHVADWSAGNAGHAPITLYIDLKDEPTTHHYDAGNLAALNDVLRTNLGADALYSPTDLEAAGAWPTVNAMRDRVVPVLTGDENAQLAYKRDRGNDPAIAINGSGQIIEVHASPTSPGDLWLWTGQIRDDGGITWHRHSRYDTGNRPAVALNNAGLIVEVHEDPGFVDDQLWYRTGQLGADYEIEWFAGASGLPFPDNDSGVTPSVAFLDPDGTEVREVHQSQTSAQHWYWSGTTIDTTSGEIDWGRPVGTGETDDDFYPRDAATFDGQAYTVGSEDDGPHDNILVVQGPLRQRIRFAPVAFTSARQISNPDLLNDELEFFAEDFDNPFGQQFATDQRAAGKLARLWKTNQLPDLDRGVPSINFWATDFPAEDWYAQLCEALDCQR